MICVFQVSVGNEVNVTVVDLSIDESTLLNLLSQVEDEDDAIAFAILDLHNYGNTVLAQFPTTNTELVASIAGRHPLVVWGDGKWTVDGSTLGEAKARLAIKQEEQAAMRWLDGLMGK